jgi:hypothetical protein
MLQHRGTSQPADPVCQANSANSYSTPVSRWNAGFRQRMRSIGGHVYSAECLYSAGDHAGGP